MPSKEVNPLADRILVVDDEPAIVELIEFNLKQQGFEVHTARDGAAAIELARRLRPDLLVLDLMLPGVDGLEVCRTLRRESDVPILMLTARKEEVDRVVGLELGADDYVTKPFSPRELLARVRAILRRSSANGKAAATGGQTRPDERLVRGDVVIDVAGHRAWRNGVEVELTHTEFQLLLALATRPGRVLTREVLLQEIWGPNIFGDPRTIDVHIRHLREKLEADPADPVHIVTVRGAGYRFSLP